MRAAADAPDRHRPTGSHGDAPEQHFAQLGHDALGVVGLADTDAARGDDGVGAGGGLREGFAQRGRIVAHHAQVDGFHAQALQHAPDGVAVAVVDAAGVQRLADGAQFVAGGKEGHAQPPPHRHLGQAQRGQQPQVGRAQQPARGQRRLATGEVFSRQAPVVAAAQQPWRYQHVIAVDLGEFLRHHRVQPGRHDRAGGDAHAGLCGHIAAEVLAGQAAADDAQPRRRIGEQLRATQRKAVHGRVVVRRHVAGRDDVTRQHSPQRIADRALLHRLHDRHQACNELLRLRHGQCIGVVSRHAGRDVLQRLRQCGAFSHRGLAGPARRGTGHLRAAGRASRR